MLQTAQTFAAPVDFSVFAGTERQRVTPASIRRSAADLVAQNRLSEADVLTHAAMQRYPDSEDILVIRALVSEVRQDWAAAETALQKLLEVQAHKAPPESWLHWVRVLRCLGESGKALTAIRLGLKLHPQHAGLMQELDGLATHELPAEKRAA